MSKRRPEGAREAMIRLRRAPVANENGGVVEPREIRVSEKQPPEDKSLLDGDNDNAALNRR
jgi:hypothetical protein